MSSNRKLLTAYSRERKNIQNIFKKYIRKFSCFEIKKITLQYRTYSVRIKKLSYFQIFNTWFPWRWRSKTKICKLLFKLLRFVKYFFIWFTDQNSFLLNFIRNSKGSWKLKEQWNNWPVTLDFASQMREFVIRIFIKQCYFS